MTKKCTKCGLTKDLEEFHKERRVRDGKCSQCKVCRREYNKKWYSENPEKIKECSKNWRKENPEKRKEYDKNWRIENPEKVREKIRRQDNCRKSDPFLKFIGNIRSLIRGSFSRKGFSKSSRTAKLLGCTFEEAQEHLEYTFVCRYGIFPEVARENGQKLHIDHIIPLASATTKQEVEELNHISNLQLLFAEDNLRKGAKKETA